MVERALTKPTTDIEELIAQEAGLDEDSYTLRPPVMTFKAGVFSIESADFVAREVEGVVILAKRARAMWVNGDAAEQRAPWCMSIGGHVGTREGQTYDCADCAYNQWGSGRDGKGKACGESRRLLVLADGFDIPVFLRLPVTSIANWDNYVTGLRGRKSIFWAVRTRIALTKVQGEAGIEWYVAGFRSVGDLDKEDLNTVLGLRHQYGELVRSMQAVDMPSEPDDVDNF